MTMAVMTKMAFTSRNRVSWGLKRNFTSIRSPFLHLSAERTKEWKFQFVKVSLEATRKHSLARAHMTTHGRLSPARSHGLQIVDESVPFQNQSVEVTHDGTFPQFHGCISKQNLEHFSFSLKELRAQRRNPSLAISVRCRRHLQPCNAQVQTISHCKSLHFNNG